MQVGLYYGNMAKEFKSDTEVTFEHVFNSMLQASTTFHFTAWSHFMTGMLKLV